MFEFTAVAPSIAYITIPDIHFLFFLFGRPSGLCGGIVLRTSREKREPLLSLTQKKSR